MSVINRLICLLGFILLFFAGASYALTMDAVIGFDGAAKSFARTPITVTLNNPGASEIDGELQVIQTSGMSDQIPSCIQRITMPSNSTKRYVIYARFRSYGSIVVRLQNGIRTLAIKKLEPSFLDSGSNKLVVSIGQRTSKPFFLDGEQLRLLKASGHGPGMIISSVLSIKVASITPDALPDKFAAYAGVDMLLAPNIPVSSIDPRALDAIGSWVASGGTLVINGGADYRALQNSFMNEMLPVVPEGAVSLSSAKLPVSPLVVTKSVLKSTKNYYVKSESGIPIIVFRRYGAGTVVFLAFDYLSKPFKDWRGQTEFWKWIMQSTYKDNLMMPASSISAEMSQDYYGSSSYPPSFNPNSDLNLTKAAESNPAIKAPSFGIILAFLLIYLIVLVPMNYVYMKKRRILEKAWYSTLAVVVVFSLLAYGIGYTMRGGRFQMQEAGVIVASDGDRYALRITDVSIFSPARRTYGLKVNDQNAVFEPTTLQGKSLNSSFYIDDNPGIEDIRMAMWSSKSFEATSGLCMKGTITSSLRYADNRIIGTIRNDSGIDLKNCRIIYNYGSSKIPDVKSGATAVIDSKLDQTLLIGSDINKADLIKRMNMLMDQVSIKGSDPIFTASTGDSTGTFDLANGYGEVKRANSIIMKLKLTSKDIKMLPVGAIKGKVLSYSGSISIYPTMSGLQSVVSFEINQSGTATSLFRLPDNANTLSILIVNSKANENSYGSRKHKITLSVQNVRTGKWDTINIGNGVRLEKPSDYIDKKHEIHVKTKLSASSSDYAYINFSISLSGSL